MSGRRPSYAFGSAARRTFDTILAEAVQGALLTADDATSLLAVGSDDTPRLLGAARSVRARRPSSRITYSPKVFLPITNLCRDRCSYCTFRKDPGEPGAWTMTPEEIRSWIRRGRHLGCLEALLCLGDRPEKAFRSYRDTLGALGHSSTVGYVREACEIALAEGLLPHTNMGLLSRDEMRELRPVNASLGLMLENVSPRLRAKGMPHHHAPDKDPALRLQMIAEAGELNIPFTTGILIGIGETLRERVDSLFAIRDLHRRYGHIQEVIVQNFRAKPTTRMAAAPEPASLDTARTVAVARLILGPEVNLQAPPNLSPEDHRLLLSAGINDWGGISPVTIDYVNPEAAWPLVSSLRRTCREEGLELAPRLCVYPEYVSREWIDPSLLGRVRAMAPDRPARSQAGGTTEGEHASTL